MSLTRCPSLKPPPPVCRYTLYFLWLLFNLYFIVINRPLFLQHHRIPEFHFERTRSPSHLCILIRRLHIASIPPRWALSFISNGRRSFTHFFPIHNLISRYNELPCFAYFEADNSTAVGFIIIIFRRRFLLRIPWLHWLRIDLVTDLLIRPSDASNQLLPPLAPLDSDFDLSPPPQRSWNHGWS